MTFVHEDPDFDVLIDLVARDRALQPGLVEKDYWVTHTLWALLDQGFELWFKGGTSLSKGYGLIQRFSEDLDLRIDPGRVEGLPLPTNWKSDKSGPVRAREAYFRDLAHLVHIPGASLKSTEIVGDRDWFQAHMRVEYPLRRSASLPASLRPFVLLELGRARVTPSIERDLSSFVHDRLETEGRLAPYDNNRPRGVRCVHPVVTLLEKLDALDKKALRADKDPAEFVRHFEDAARIAQAFNSLPRAEGYSGPRALAQDLVTQKQAKRVPRSDFEALLPADGERWEKIRDAHRAIVDMFWGERLSLEEACEALRAWIAEHIDAP